LPAMGQGGKRSYLSLIGNGRSSNIANSAEERGGALFGDSAWEKKARLKKLETRWKKK